MSKKITDYKDLLVWQKALGVIEMTIDLVDMLPGGAASDIIGKQIIGSSTSVCANIAEGYSSGSIKEYSRILKIAFREAKETDNWLQVVRKSKKLSKPNIIAQAELIESDNTEVIRMLFSLKKSIQKYIDK